MKRYNITRVLSQLIGELHIPITRQSIEEEIALHPNYNSLLAISDILNNWGVPNASYQLDFKELIESEVPVPFVAYLANQEFALVSNLDERYAVVSNERWNKYKLPIDDFKSIYKEHVLLAERNEDSGEADYNKKYRKEVIKNLRLPIVISGSIITLIAFLLFHSSFVSSLNWSICLLTLFKTLGVITSILLLIQSVDANNPLVQKLCGGDNNKDCNAILSSKAAKISDELSWSEVGFFYFAGTWLALLFNSDHVSIIHTLSILNLISLPYTFYSIYYQWRVAKQWCVFCCTVQILLWIEFFAFFPYLFYKIQAPNIQEYVSLLTSVILPMLTWLFFKTYLIQATQIQPLKRQLRNFKYNVSLFQKLLNEEVKYDLPDEECSLIIGNCKAENIITVVSNPYCQPCSRAQITLDEWLSSRSDIKLQIVFSSQNDNEDDMKTKVPAHFMALKISENETVIKKALNEWYEYKDYDTWAKNYPVEISDSSKFLQKQKEWCELTEIKVTPTIFINGRKLPAHYQLKDIKYFI
jgi:uncharacterized membrane protein/glutaredoxin